MSFKLPTLPYAYNSLEPHFDSRTMEIHHSKHHQGYTNNLNAAIKGTPLEGQSIEAILEGMDMENMPLRNNAGGFYNHNLFWKVLSPDGGGTPKGKLSAVIDETFGSFEAFKEAFSKAAATRFGSGWAFLCVSKEGKLTICSTPNQDNPLMCCIDEGYPILALDVWEHAYYLKYQNRRPDYIKAFFEIINWSYVAQLYEEKV